MPDYAAFAGIPRVPPPVNDPTGATSLARPSGRRSRRGSRRWRASASRFRSSSAARRSAPDGCTQAVMPHDHAHVLADWHGAESEHVLRAIAAAAEARREWASWAWHERAAVFLRAAELLATTWRATINAATMLGQSKTVFQAEIDAASELVDFWRFNPYYAQQLYEEQPLSPSGMWNALEYRPLEGFVYRGDAVQFHLDRRQPAHRAGADGQHRPVEAVGHGDLQQLLHHAPARGGRPAAWRHQLRARRPRAHFRDRAHLVGSRRRPLHRQHRRVQRHVEDGRQQHGRAIATTRASSARRAARTSSWRIPRPTPRRWPWRSCAAASSSRGRSARRPAASTCRRRCGPTSAIAPSR